MPWLVTEVKGEENLETELDSVEEAGWKIFTVCTTRLEQGMAEPKFAIVARKE